ncbi:General transcription factor IIH subunit 3 [Acropora cervicornis]|uniref:General transcription factor IIH subunit 3 n=1 Tax=Acropora cervicornis TaxID=6130 RepID=A0AAD9R6G3_ACRCE|nr:General transcription factor IIH subunit 3 [Acropora cervicornis]
MADENISNLLLVIVDANPVWWGRIAHEKTQVCEEQINLTHCVDSLMVFSNAHLMMKHNNCLSFIISHTNTSKFVFPKEENHITPDATQSDIPTDGKYEGFAEVNDAIVAELKALLTSDVSTIGQKLKSRILVLKAAPDVSTQYMAIMNCIFAAQKSNTVIDACVLNEHSGFLQQAADITGGLYLKVPRTLALLQYLLWVFLPEPDVREQLVLPSSLHIDYRAACFCHRQLVDIGFVCSVCLSSK